jgi:RNA polymerase sigma factor, sigma-70 family
MSVVNDRILQIDEQEFKNLFDEFYQALCVFASTYLKDDALAADIVQEGFVKFWNKREGFDNYFKVKSFLYTMVRNDCLNYIRDHKLKREDLSVIESLEFYTEVLVEEEAYRIFYNAVESLPYQTRQVIECALDGMKSSEIADCLGIAESSVHTLKKLAYKKLRIVLKEYYYLVFIFLVNK